MLTTELALAPASKERQTPPPFRGQSDGYTSAPHEWGWSQIHLASVIAGRLIVGRLDIEKALGPR
jgi:hypothetical protein